MKPLLKKLLNILRVVLGIGLLYYVLTVTSGWETVLALRHHLGVLLGLLALPLFGAAVESVRLGLLSRAQGMQLSFARGYQLVAIGTLFNFAIPGGTGGDVMKLYYMATANRKRMVEAALVVFVDRVVALSSMLVLLLILALLNLNLVRQIVVIRWLVLIAVVALGALAVVTAVSFSRRWRNTRLYGWAMQKLPLSHQLERIFDALYAYRARKKALLGAAGWSLVGHLALTTMFLAVGLALIPGAPVRMIPFLSLLGILANIIPITPGGLGVGETALEQLFGLVGFSGGAALMLAWRMSMLPLCVIGAIFYALGLRQWQLVTTDTIPVSEQV